MQPNRNSWTHLCAQGGSLAPKSWTGDWTLFYSGVTQEQRHQVRAVRILTSPHLSALTLELSTDHHLVVIWMQWQGRQTW